jgi:hypothetical protein
MVSRIAKIQKKVRGWSRQLAAYFCEAGGCARTRSPASCRSAPRLSGLIRRCSPRTRASLQAIADHAAHKKLDTTRGYVQVADAFRDHSGKASL